MLKEKDITKQIIDYLKIMHIPVFRNNVGLAKYANKDGSTRFVSFGQVGMPDHSIIIFHKGLPLLGFIEMKATRGTQTQDQKLFEAWCRQNNILYVLARSVEDLQEGLKAYKKQIE